MVEKKPSMYRKFNGKRYGLFGSRDIRKKPYMKTKKEAEANRKRAIAHGKRRYGSKPNVRTVKTKRGYNTYVDFKKN